MRALAKTVGERHVPQRMVVIVALLGSCALSGGLPLPSSPLAAKVGTRAFPCQTRQCGCRSAEQCRRSCCCFSKSERLAWARSQRESMAWWNDDRETSSNANPTRAQSTEAPRSSCCEESSSDPCGDKKQTAPGGVLAWQAQRCAGLSSWWVAQVVSPMPLPLTEWATQPNVGNAIIVVSLWTEVDEVSPPVPPPESPAFAWSA